jgi:hypothetical protein
MLVCYGFPAHRRRLVNNIKEKLLSAHLEVIVAFDPSPDSTEKAIAELANYNLQNNKPLIVETFT